VLSILLTLLDADSVTLLILDSIPGKIYNFAINRFIKFYDR
jgi:hypothetical protein